VIARARQGGVHIVGRRSRDMPALWRSLDELDLEGDAGVHRSLRRDEFMTAAGKLRRADGHREHPLRISCRRGDPGTAGGVDRKDDRSGRLGGLSEGRYNEIQMLYLCWTGSRYSPSTTSAHRETFKILWGLKQERTTNK